LESALNDDQSAANPLRQELLDLQERLQVSMPTLYKHPDAAHSGRDQFQRISGRLQSTLQSSENQFLERYRSLLGEALNEIYTEGDCDLILRSVSIAASGFTYNVTFEVTAKLNELITDLSAAEQ
jgi:Skp family chaperone for outer membrane proteins